MTKQEAIAKHRAMWRWIAGIIEEKKCHVDISSLKEIFCKGNHGYCIDNNCYLCEYEKDAGGCLKGCPLEWPGKNCVDKRNPIFFDVLYEQNWKKQAALARQIAEMPEKTENNPQTDWREQFMKRFERVE